MDLTGFDLVGAASEKALIPSGEYKAIVVSSAEYNNAKGTGAHLAVEIEIVEGEFENRKIIKRYNLVNSNPQAVDIARKQLAELCRACGVPNPAKSSDLHLRTFTAVIGTDKQGEWNELKRCKPYVGPEVTESNGDDPPF